MFCLLLCVLLALAAPSHAQNHPVATFSTSVGSEFVQIPVVVRDRKGQFVDDLKQKDFHVWVEGKPVAIRSFERNERGPVSFAILVDVSGSMSVGGKLDHAKEAIRRLIELRKPGDDFALYAFSDDEVRVVTNF